MSILKIRDENGNVIEIPVLKGDKGDPGPKGDDASTEQIAQIVDGALEPYKYLQKDENLRTNVDFLNVLYSARINGELQVDYNISCSAEPVGPPHITNKQYVDNAISEAISGISSGGGSVDTGQINQLIDDALEPYKYLQKSESGYTFFEGIQVSGISNFEGTLYADRIYGYCDMSDEPTDRSIVNKKYVDDAVASVGGGGNIDLSNYYTKGEIDTQLGDIETSLENIIAKYGLGGGTV